MYVLQRRTPVDAISSRSVAPPPIELVPQQPPSLNYHLIIPDLLACNLSYTIHIKVDRTALNT